MESYIQISKINDFIFCPRSVYLHSVYDDFYQSTYHSTCQTIGKIKHEGIEKGTYSSLKRYLQGLEVFSEKYNLGGKIDIYDTETKTLIERKFKIKRIYDGYKYQLYAQMFCLTEMGYLVNRIVAHSLSDNKRFIIPLPSETEIKRFESVIQKIKEIDVKKLKIIENKEKCRQCVYKSLCH